MKRLERSEAIERLERFDRPTRFRSHPASPHACFTNMPNKRRSPSDWTQTSPSIRPFDSQLAERAGAFGKLDTGLRTFA